jgi:transposase-like protein
VGRPSIYPEAFRREACELVRRGDHSMRQVVAGLGLPDQTRHNWMRAEDKTKLKSLPTVPVRPSRSIISRLAFSQEGSARTAYATRAPEHPIKRRASIYGSLEGIAVPQSSPCCFGR